jgi:peptidoglycan/xylan/chitin deacetylase (PgdA/CDA1 family)
LQDFARQLDWLGQHFEFLELETFKRAVEGESVPDRNGVVLTFDDGFRDHYEYVLPELEKRGLWGIFYIPTRVYHDGRLLDVHRIHLILGAAGGHKARLVLEQLIEDYMLSESGRLYFARHTYKNQTNDSDTTEFKRILNYYIDYQYREHILDLLVGEILGDEHEVAGRFYMNREQVRDLHQKGMVIGGHTVSHPVLSKLSREKQEREVKDCVACLADITGEPITTFCYPFGGPGTYTTVTKTVLRDAGVSTCFIVQPRDVEAKDLKEQRLELPRYDCNLFPYGKASAGLERAGQ